MGRFGAGDRDAQRSLTEALTILAREMGGESTLIHPQDLWRPLAG